MLTLSRNPLGTCFVGCILAKKKKKKNQKKQKTLYYIPNPGSYTGISNAYTSVFMTVTEVLNSEPQELNLCYKRFNCSPLGDSRELSVNKYNSIRRTTLWPNAKFTSPVETNAYLMWP